MDGFADVATGMEIASTFHTRVAAVVSRTYGGLREPQEIRTVVGRMVHDGDHNGKPNTVDVIALLSKSRPRYFALPEALDSEAAVRLPHLLLCAQAALQRAGLSNEAAAADKHVLIAGSAGTLPWILVQLLLNRGAMPLVAGVAECESFARFTDLTGVATLDVSQPSFSEVVAGAASAGRLHAVMDCLGCEEAPELIEERLGVHYVSLASPGLLTLASDGAISQVLATVADWFRTTHSRWSSTSSSKESDEVAGSAVLWDGSADADKLRCLKCDEVFMIIHES